MSATNKPRDPVETARKESASQARSPPDPSRWVGTPSTWEHLEAQLSPVIGAIGVDVLFRRSLELTSANYPWLAPTAKAADCAAMRASLDALLAERATDAVAEVENAVLTTFVELLTNLIGQSLAERLLSAGWSPSSPTAEPENEP